MQVKILKEVGYEQAALGLSLSHGIEPERAREVAERLAGTDYGENKFMESIMVWLDVRAPRFWWQEADTYRLSTKQSESTMHTIHKRDLVQEDFEYPLPQWFLDELDCHVRAYRQDKSVVNLLQLKNMLPEGFLQTRVWAINYKTLRNIILQRRAHRLPQWQIFCREVQAQAQHPELLPAV